MTTIDPGQGWRLLARGETQQDGDEFFYDRDKKWHPVYCVGHVLRSKEIIRRRIEPVDNIGVEVTTSGPYVAIEVHRAALAEIERLKAELDAVKNPQPSPEPEWFDLTSFGEHVLRKNTDWGDCSDPADWIQPNWPPVTTTVDRAKSCGWNQFRCLLKDAPPELVAKANKPAENAYGFCPICGAPGVFRERRLKGNDRCSNGHEYWSKNAKLNRPAEDPDEWVTITDENHVARRNIDHIRIHDGKVEPVLGLTGMLRKNITNELICRRRDLPPMPDQKLKTEAVTFYEVMVWRDGTRKLEWNECPSEACVGTGRTETRTIKGSL